MSSTLRIVISFSGNRIYPGFAARSGELWIVGAGGATGWGMAGAPGLGRAVSALNAGAVGTSTDRAGGTAGATGWGIAGTPGIGRAVSALNAGAVGISADPARGCDNMLFPERRSMVLTLSTISRLGKFSSEASDTEGANAACPGSISGALPPCTCAMPTQKRPPKAARHAHLTACHTPSITRTKIHPCANAA